MLDGGIEFALACSAVLVACAIMTACAGHFFGTWAATLLVLSLWILGLAGLGSILGLNVTESGIEWAGMLVIGEFLFFSLGMIFVPMLFLKNCSWIKGRLIGGLAGAAIVAIVIYMTAPMVVH